MSRRSLIPLGSFIRDPVIKKGFFWAFLLLILTLALILSLYSQLPPVTPLFYSLVRGEGQLAPKPFLFILPISSAIFFTTHLLLAQIHFETDRMFARILAVTSSLVTFLFFIALLHIIIIVL